MVYDSFHIFILGYQFLNLDTKFEMLVSIMDTSEKFQSRTLTYNTNIQIRGEQSAF